MFAGWGQLFRLVERLLKCHSVVNMCIASWSALMEKKAPLLGRRNILDQTIMHRSGLHCETKQTLAVHFTESSHTGQAKCSGLHAKL
jgi:hypothetical protein